MVLQYKEYLNESSKMERDWIINQVEKTNKPHDQIKKEFLQKFGSNKSKFFDKIVSEIVD